MVHKGLDCKLFFGISQLEAPSARGLRRAPGSMPHQPFVIGPESALVVPRRAVAAIFRLPRAGSLISLLQEAGIGPLGAQQVHALFGQVGRWGFR